MEVESGCGYRRDKFWATRKCQPVQPPPFSAQICEFHQQTLRSSRHARNKAIAPPTWLHLTRETAIAP